MSSSTLSSSVDVLVLGATGLCGRLLVRHFASHPELNVTFTLGLCARSKTKLESVYEEFGVDVKDVPAFVFDLTDHQKAEDIIAKAKVVINMAGPYASYARSIIKACIKNRVHYLDLSGETVWIQENIADLHALAQQAGIIVSHYCGLDSVPSDIILHLANKTLKAYASKSKSKEHSNLIAESISSFQWPLALSAGSMAAGWTQFDDPPDNLADSLLDTAFCPSTTGKPWPAPKLTYKLQDPKTDEVKHGAILLLASPNRAWVRRTWGLLEELGDEKMRYGPDLVYDESWECRSKLGALGTSLAFIGMIIGASIKPTRMILKRLFANGMGGSCVSLDEMERRSCSILNITKSTTTPGNSIPTTVRTTVDIKGDAGYLVTSILIGECALSALPANKHRLPPLGRKGGFLTSMTAFGDVLIERLERTGRFRFASEVVDPKKIDAPATKTKGRALTALASMLAIVSFGMVAWRRFLIEV
ncbi:NAD-P-binding protein [Flagelloscypha sp. PMI_526]|nr:NAD-P-binding protein [Flagelloscypha sp. PMI_526]